MRTKKPLIIVAVFVGICLLVALVLIAPTSPSAGLIQDKRYTQGEWDRDCKGTGKKRTCKTEWESEICEFYLVDGRRMGWAEVPCSTYNNMTVGQYYRG